ncbi:MAG: hypothetical protein AAB815_00260 [Patescibacteria group bacterium]
MSKNPFEERDPRDPGLRGMEKGAILEMGDFEFLATFDISGKRQAQKFVRMYGGEVRDYGVNIMRMDPMTREVKNEEFDYKTSMLKDADWTKVEGFSVWRKIKK